ncbi:hypothetical protein F4779DRAFT_566626 [Xylariaceae sp. FL0662B]|nr:hypothetical protein F4779DRAFT_566626 [Xylariaceae sp. FL0662B]
MKNKRRWTCLEDKILQDGFQAQSACPTGKGQTVNWKEIANRLPGRSNKDCRKRYLYEMAGTLKKGPWSKEEDNLLMNLVEKQGPSWVTISHAMGTRNADQCSKRWHNSLNPELHREPWQEIENQTLLRALATHGSSWTDIQRKHFPTRSANSIKNQYTILVRRGAKFDSSMPCCCPPGGKDEATPSPSDLSSPLSGSLDLAGGQCQQPQDDGSLTHVPSEMPGVEFDEIFADVFNDSSSSLELSTPSKSDDMGSATFSPVYAIDRDKDMMQAVPHQIAMHNVSESNYLMDPYMNLINGLHDERIGGISDTILPHMDGTNRSSDISTITDGAGSNPQTFSAADWGKGNEVQAINPGEDSRMTIIIDEARPETLFEVMKVLMDSRARVEFRRG